MKVLIAAIAALLLICSIARAGKILPVPYVHQKLDTPDWFEDGGRACGATSLTMILAYYGKISEPFGDHVPKIHEYIYDPVQKAAVWSLIVEYAQSQGLDSVIEWSPTFEEIQKEIDSNYPLVLSVNIVGDDGKERGHLITVIGYTDDHEVMVVNDPAGYYISWKRDGEAVEYPWDSLKKIKGAILVRSPEPIPPVVDWPSQQRDNQNTGNNNCAGNICTPKQDDSMTIEGVSAYAQPVVSGKMVYLALQNGEVVASDMEKKLCSWFFDTGAEEIKLTPALSGNKLYVLDSNNILWCLDKNTGDWIWYFDIPEYFGLPDYYWQTSPQIWQNYICLTVGPYVIFIYDDTQTTGKAPRIAKLVKIPITIQQDPPEFIATSAISKNGIFYCFDFACNIVAFKVETGEYLWHLSEFPGPQNPAGLTYLGNPFAIVLAEDILILKNNWRYDFQDTEPKPGETGFLYGVNINSPDKILWTREIGLTSCPSVYKDGELYSYGLFAPEPGKIEGVIYCLDPNTGNLLTLNAIGVNDDIHLSIGGDILYFTCWTFKKVFAVNFDPFEILWEQDLQYHPFSAVVPVGDAAYISMLDIDLKTKTASLWPSAKTKPRTTSSLVITSFSEASYQKGDVSGNGEITAYDASLVLRYVVGLIGLSLDAKDAADVSGNGTITALDAALILQYTVGLITDFDILAAPSLYAKTEEEILQELLSSLRL